MNVEAGLLTNTMGQKQSKTQPSTFTSRGLISFAFCCLETPAFGENINHWGEKLQSTH